MARACVCVRVCVCACVRACGVTFEVKRSVPDFFRFRRVDHPCKRATSRILVEQLCWVFPKRQRTTANDNHLVARNKVDCTRRRTIERAHKFPMHSLLELTLQLTSERMVRAEYLQQVALLVLRCVK
jgi:hypothetical protein